MKTCSRCKRTRPEEEFHWRNRERGQRQARCKDCARDYAQDHYTANRGMYLRKAARWNRTMDGITRARLLAYVKEHPCVDCGEMDPLVLTFDHVRGVKRQSLARMMNGKFSWATIQEEIAKCDVRCANCHMRRTAHQFGWWKALQAVEAQQDEHPPGTREDAGSIPAPGS